MKTWMFLGLWVAASGCDDGAQSAQPPPPPAGPTWHGEAGALITQHCVGCHQEGGAAPFALDTYAAAAPLAAAIADSVAAGRMPPWNPDPDCREMVNQRVLPAGTAEILANWATQGAPEGEPSDMEQPPPAASTFEANLITTAAAPYLPDAATPDDYRCLVLDAEFAEDTYVHGLQVVPDQGALVHHVLLYAIPPADVPDLLALDDASEGEGYPCFGGVEIGLPSTQGGWVPGSGANVWPDGRASIIQAGSKLVMQVHYNLAVAPTLPDQTAVHIMATTEAPAHILAGQPLAVLDLAIDAGDAESVITRDFTWYQAEPFEFVGLAGHMHLLGTAMSVKIIRAGDAGEACVLDIPRWDFAWQEMFLLVEPLQIRTGDRVRLTCHFDNSAGNQPVVNGEQLEPRDITWGESTLDEMCYASLMRSQPWTPELANQTTCTGVQECRATCDDADSLPCIARCIGNDRACGQCMISALAMCGIPTCIDPLTASQDCISNCLIFGGDPDACMQDACPQIYTDLSTCLTDALPQEGCPGIDACQ
ncbi:MAG: mono/diheme cytochrome c family protein [Bradymonadia bacterium]|jgi:mono/diheme cytochrome c family protein